MTCLLLVLGMALLCGMRATDVTQTMGSLDLTKVAGTWHSMAMAASDISLLDSASSPLRMYIQELRPTPEDNLEIITSQQENHLCVRRSITARRTEDPAVFAVAYEGERKISVLDTDYTDYMFFCMDATEPTAEQGTVCQYLARTLKVDNKVMEKFHRTFQTLPVHMRIILDLTQGREQCRV
ncbi:beta-lactoglobulin-2-like isoform X2 [Manis pentadactyla]|uniref:beta-lactoglobulin-2-like isoform X2 n=1 Tax=Manis pentadactyla TaxID=143292 RepID=UPI00255D0BD8|nr:beta-lactoglobulin-2-like isoform X2 [Manis pentadactyla]KAI5253547.1 Glycodelin [Manis pentadactyla]